MPKTFKGKIVLITGAGSGIGRATAIKLSHQGATLALTDINLTSLEETVSLCASVPAAAAHFDVSSPEQCNNFINGVMENYSKIDHIFNCAGRNVRLTFPLICQVSLTDFFRAVLQIDFPYFSSLLINSS